MLTLEEQNIILSSLPKNSRFKKYIKNGYTLEEAKIIDKRNNKGYKEYWIEKGYSEKDAIKIIKENNAGCKEYWIKIGYSEEEAIYKIKSKNPTKKEYWIERGYSEKDAIYKIKSNRKDCKEYWIKRGYSEEEANKILNQRIKKTHKNHKEYWIEKGCSNEEAIKLAKNESDKISKRISNQFKKEYNILCKEHWIAKGYPEEEAIKLAKESNLKQTKNRSNEKISISLKKLYQNLNLEQKKAKQIRDEIHSVKMKGKNKTHSPIFKEYWITKGMSEEEAILKVNEIKYGHRKNGVEHASKIELKFFNELKEFLKIDIIQNKWLRINDRNFCADGKYNNLIFEFNGTFFHMDNRFYTKNDKNPRGVPFEQVKEKDNIKISYYLKKDYDIFIIWEYDYINNKEKLFNYIREAINAKESNKKRIYWDSSSVFNKC